MRFAISLLTLVAIASVIGTVLRQNEPLANYLNQFGPFWFRVFEAAGLYAVYNAPWFIAIMAFLVLSTSVCIWRNTPGMLRQMATYREGIRESSMRAMAHQTEFACTLPTDQALHRATQYLQAQGFRLRAGATGVLAAKSGSFSRLGYLAAHSAIVAICVGGLLDSNVPLQLKLALGEARPASSDTLLSQMPASARLSADNASFRGNTLIPEGGASSVAVINAGDGVLVQELPFTLTLNRFHIEHYSTGQPKLFASDVLVTDRETKQSFSARIEVNKPLQYRGVTVYQASFDDGGTLLNIRGHHMLAPRAQPLQLNGRIGENAELRYDGATYRIEWVGFRPINVENLATVGEAGANDTDREARGLFARVRDQMGSGREAMTPRELRNVGPSFSYKLRDAAGQAREYNNYQLPVHIDGRPVFLTGVRDTPSDRFRYVRIPADEALGIDEFLRLRAGLLDPSLRVAIAQRFAANAVRGGSVSPALQARLAESAERALTTFSARGYQSVAEFLEQAVPEAERDGAAQIYLRVLQGATWEAWQLRREKDRLPVLDFTPARVQFVQDSLNAVSDLHFYGVPIWFSLDTFDEVKASVFQMTRSPGRNLVYLGCVLLILGVFAMLYVRERRMWLLVRDGIAVLAMQTNRRTLDANETFTRHQHALMALLSTPSSSKGAVHERH